MVGVLQYMKIEIDISRLYLICFLIELMIVNFCKGKNMIKRLIIILLFSLNAYCADKQKVELEQYKQLELLKMTKGALDQIHSEVSASVILLCEYTIQHKEINFDSKVVINTIAELVYRKYLHLLKDPLQQNQLYAVLCNLTSLYMDIFYTVERMFSEMFFNFDDSLKKIYEYIESLECYKHLFECTQQSLKDFAKNEVEKRAKIYIEKYELAQ